MATNFLLAGQWSLIISLALKMDAKMGVMVVAVRMSVISGDGAAVVMAARSSDIRILRRFDSHFFSAKS